MNPCGPTWPVTHRVFPDGESSMLSADIPMPAVAPPVCATGVNIPVVELIENTEMSNDPELATYRKLPDGSIASKVGAVPTFCRGVTSVSAPPLEMVNKDTVPLGVAPELAAYKNLFEGWITSDCTACPAVIGLPTS